MLILGEAGPAYRAAPDFAAMRYGISGTGQPDSERRRKKLKLQNV